MTKGLKVKSSDGEPLSPRKTSYNKSTGSAGAAQRSARSKKSAAAFRTISEVADELGVKQHVLRFWETKFSQLKPLKRGGGRRYYRPEDVDLLKAVYALLYIEGYTIKGVQKLLREAGKKQIVAMFSGEDSASALDAQTKIQKQDAQSESSTGAAQNLTAEQRQALEQVLAELKELRGMVKNRR
ncbi:MAG: MerR family transcriptional regulator [Alphaproteobacteria bacterium]